MTAAGCRPHTSIASRMALLGMLAWGTLAGPLRADDWQAMESRLVAVVRARFYDKRRADDWAQSNAHFSRDVRDAAGYDEAARAAVGRLRTSHTAYYTADEPRYHGLRSIFRGPMGLSPRDVEVDSIGVDLAAGGFIRVIFAGSPASRAGLKRGDRIVLADGKPFEPIASLRGRARSPVKLSVQGRPGGPLREVTLMPRKIDPKREWLEDQEKGARIAERGGKKVAVMRLFSAAGEEHEAVLRNAIAGDFAAADALVLDLRDGWGGASPSFVNLFNRTPPVVEMTERGGSKAIHDTQWRKPLVLLVNEGAKSGKEIVAYAVKKHKLGTLVGMRTGGAVLAGTPIPLGNRALLYLAVADVRVDGERLEGFGVSPDVVVTEDLSYADGRDDQLDRAIDVAAKP
ncbi:putative CtpA-like serine protease [Aquisphaera giovannonii]|uniref:Putative CtpA-like serine protease n=1 Tax=Aquisphaera giovannonii TaxID=406548 RepID=A0A5B9VZA0_9BACT|nr:S41 family peptidase [Aquisphaera giovannonii]QEH33608.1 putative CtpA-like serine protease [Aquisphaera giovannonii]